MKTTFRTPSGPDIPDISLDRLRLFVLEEGSDYWNDPKGSGDGTLEQQAEGVLRGLGLTFKEPFGFMVTYLVMGEESLVALSSNDFTATTEVVFQGIPWTVPVAFFLSRQMTWEVVKEFCTSGQMHQGVTWDILDKIWP
jgi:hypothetical protein